jgi:hypothetical protein
MEGHLMENLSNKTEVLGSRPRWPTTKAKKFTKFCADREKSSVRDGLGLLPDDMVRKVKNRSKPNHQIFSEYFAIIGKFGVCLPDFKIVSGAASCY